MNPVTAPPDLIQRPDRSEISDWVDILDPGDLNSVIIIARTVVHDNAGKALAGVGPRAERADICDLRVLGGNGVGIQCSSLSIVLKNWLVRAVAIECQLTEFKVPQPIVIEVFRNHGIIRVVIFSGDAVRQLDRGSILSTATDAPSFLCLNPPCEERAETEMNPRVRSDGAHKRIEFLGGARIKRIILRSRSGGMILDEERARHRLAAPGRGSPEATWLRPEQTQ